MMFAYSWRLLGFSISSAVIKMNTKHNIITKVSVIKKIVIFTEVLILFLVISSSIAMAYTGFSEENKSSNNHKNTVNQTEFTQKFGLAPINPKFIKYQNNIKSNNVAYSSVAYTPTRHTYGHIPSPIDFSHLKHNPLENIYAMGNPSIPISYDLRSLNRVTPVKNQENTNTCWAFGANGALESSLMPGQQYNFSEQNMRNLLSENYTDGFDRSAVSGADAVRATAYLSRWSGPVNSSDDPWNPTVYTSPKGLPIQKHVQNITYLPNRDNSLDNLYLKLAIMNYGGIDSGMCFEDSNYSEKTYGYYYNGTSDADHDVTIVGWNDSYSAGQHQPLNVTFTPSESNDYTNASKTVYINVNISCP
jgi:C1A family cysteine protease